MRNGNGTVKQRPDFAAIAGWVSMGSSVLDLGCGDGNLLRYLRESRSVTGYGIEIEDDGVLDCVKNGVNVIQGDLERGLSDFEDRSFDYVILSLTLQAVKHRSASSRTCCASGARASSPSPTSATGRTGCR